ncbi:pentapeptide repeat-containing protein [Actinomadura sp. 6N118]|uniref:pentapeptide repeat-containing protein n=1 Tax=Actinomadura sp. 6N118 TaxID=3375151 RepID=UPI00379202D3
MDRLARARGEVRSYGRNAPVARRAGWALAGAALLTAAAAYGLALWKMPDLMHLAAKADRHSARLLVATVGGAIVVATGLFFTWRGYRLSHRGQVTDRFAKALERLGSDDMDVRLGGIHALAHVANDSPPHHNDVLEVLATFIRRRVAERAVPAAPTGHRTVWLHEPEASPEPDRPPGPEADVQHALTTLGRRGRRPERLALDFSGLHLTGAELSSARLAGAILRATDLTRTHLTSADLTGANLFRANLTRALLTGANLTGANLTDADLTGAYLARADLTGAHLKRANLTGAHLNRANLTEADLTGARLTGADLTGARLSGADLTRADLTGANLWRANLTGANLTHANLTGANLTDANLTGANLTGANLTDADLAGADLTGANLLGTDLRAVKGVTAQEVRAVARTDGGTWF